MQQIVNLTAIRMNVTVRATWQFGGPLANAFAVPTTHELVFSKRLLEICTDEEISAICAHELAHLKESKTVLAGRLLGSLMLFPLIFITPSIHHFGATGFFLPYLGLIIIAKSARWLSHRMEKRADQIALTEQTNEGIYASALEKLYRESQIPAVNVNNKQTHPHLYDRMLAARITPDYPRPTKPRRLTLFGWLYVFLVGGVIALAVSDNYNSINGYAKYSKGDWDGAIADYTKVIESKPDDADAYIGRGDAKYAKGELDGAMADFNKAIGLNPKDAYAYDNRGYSKSTRGDVDGAMADFNKAIELNPEDAYALKVLGYLKTRKGDFDGAMADFNKAG
ncbi:MAG TPA: tetratricopeptide repeat protein, partial [Phycisphaerae bacterium]|nr:tetratricopeptide repeat protein [Phycisphaerae bacterium]